MALYGASDKRAKIYYLITLALWGRRPLAGPFAAGLLVAGLTTGAPVPSACSIGPITFLVPCLLVGLGQLFRRRLIVRAPSPPFSPRISHWRWAGMFSRPRMGPNGLAFGLLHHHDVSSPALPGIACRGAPY